LVHLRWKYYGVFGIFQSKIINGGQQPFINCLNIVG
jgi:hypothetical protein